MIFTENVPEKARSKQLIF